MNTLHDSAQLDESVRSQEQVPATRVRRRGGRRVVRAAGAAGAKLPVKVHERASAVKPTTVSVPSSASLAQETADDRRRRLSVELFSDPEAARRTAAKSEAASSSSRRSRSTSRAVRPADGAVASDDSPVAPSADCHVRRPMTSLLFQEPVLPAQSSSDALVDDTEEEKKPRRRRTRSHASREDRSPRATKADNGRTDAKSDDDTDTETGAKSDRTRRRLNAEERAAAAEIEQIEEDIKRERSRRYPRSGSSEGTVDSADEDPRQSEESGEATTMTRRRRPTKRIVAPSATTSRYKREQQYIEKIKDVEGSTRLEAKRQRRRDNRRERSRQTLITEQDFLARRENVDRQMIVREKGRHTQISVIEDDILVEHYVSDIDEVSTVGNIYLGRVQNVLPSMEAAFVNIGEARNGVLYSGEVNWDSARLEGHPRRIELAYHSGAPILVQVTKDPIGHKGARLTSQVTLAGRYIVLVPFGGMTGVSRKLPDRERARLKKIVDNLGAKNFGIIIRTAAEGASEEAVAKDYQMLLAQWNDVLKQYDEFEDSHRPRLLRGEQDVAIRVVRDTFNDDFRQLVVEGENVYGRIKHYLSTMAPDLLGRLHYWDPAEHAGQDVFDRWKIDGQLRKGMERQVYLPSGGSLVIDRTEAMTTIDVNTGRFIGKGKSLEETVTRCNLEAAEEIVRQLRLRDIGGMIMIDFVDMVLESNRDLVLHRLVECLSRDHTKHQVAEVTSLGLVQMTRKRVGQGLVEAFSEECPTCHGRGFIIHEDPTIDSSADDPYEVKGGDPFEKPRGRHHAEQQHATASARESALMPTGSSTEVKAKLAAIAAAATKRSERAGSTDEKDRSEE